MNPTIQTTYATAEQIKTIADKIQGVIEGENEGHILITLLSLVILIQRPDISAENLQMAVNEVSKFTCLLLDGIGIEIEPEEDVEKQLKLTLN